MSETPIYSCKIYFMKYTYNTGTRNQPSEHERLFSKSAAPATRRCCIFPNTYTYTPIHLYIHTSIHIHKWVFFESASRSTRRYLVYIQIHIHTYAPKYVYMYTCIYVGLVRSCITTNKQVP